jgi:hypothetical protein
VKEPAENSWIHATGSWRKPPGTKTPRLTTPILDTTDVTPAQPPANPYDE